MLQYKMTRIHLLPKRWHLHCLSPHGPVTFLAKVFPTVEALIQDSPAIDFEGCWIQDSRSIIDRRLLDSIICNRPYHWPDIPDGSVRFSTTGKVRQMELLDSIGRLSKYDQIGADIYSMMILDLVPDIRIGQVTNGSVEWISRTGEALAA